MTDPRARRVLWLLVVLSLVPAGILIARRVAAEGVKVRVAMVMDEEALATQADALGIDSLELGLRYKQLGLTGVALYEDTPASLAAKGKVAVLLGSDALAQAALAGTEVPAIAGDTTLLTGLEPGALDDALAKNTPAPDTVRLAGRTWYAFPGDVVNTLPMGPDSEQVAAWHAAGFDIAYRPRNASYELLAPGSDFPPEAHYLVYAGTQVAGFPFDLSPLVAASQAYLTAIIEGTPQDGLPSLVRKVPTTRLLSFNQDYIDRRLSPTELIDKYLLAVGERNVRLLYLRPYTTTEQGDMVANTERLVSGLQAALQREGYVVGPLTTLDVHYQTSSLLRGLASIGVLAGLLLLAGSYRRPWGLVVALAILGLGLAAGGLRWDAIALVAALSFAALGYVTFRRGAFAVVGATLVSLAGAALLVAVGSERDTMLAIRPFAGVGATLVVPPVLFLFQYALRYRQPAAYVRDLWREPVRLGHVVLVMVVLAALGLAFLRRGNTPILPPTEAELHLRQWLAELFVRPRFKELLGHPLAVLGLANRRWPAWLRGVLLTGGVVAQASVLNTFSHYHTPLVVSLQRTVLALGIGLVIGLALVPLSRGLVALGRAWLRSAGSAPAGAVARDAEANERAPLDPS